jgi:hypothetical protein
MSIDPLRRTRQPLSETEWNFKNCPDEEVRDCFYYEFHREIPEVREWITKWRNDTEGTDFEALESSLTFDRMAELGNRLDLPDVSWFPIYPEWPEKPFLSIPDKERRARRHRLDPEPASRLSWRLYPSTEATRRGLPIDWERIADAFENSGMWPVAAVEENAWIAPFKIDWEHSDKQLSEAFDSWLKTCRPDTIKQRKSKTGGGSELREMRADLKALGAFRQRAQRTFEDVQSQSQYSDQSAWLKAARKAEAIIAGLRKNFTKIE